MNIELFPCSGGMAEGFRRAGVTFDLAVDKDPNAAASYAKNLGHRPILMDVHDLLRMVKQGLQFVAADGTPKVIDLLVADPPCTPWSRAGKRLGTEDDRDMLEETAELIALLRPRAYLIGNVPGLQDSTSWGVVQRVIGGLARHGYCVVDYAQLDAADYGVPQHRIRPFWFGHLDGPCVQWPAPTHTEPKLAAMPALFSDDALLPWVTCRQALQHLPLEELGRPVTMKRADTNPASEPDAPAMAVKATDGAGNAKPHLQAAYADNPRHRPNRPDEPSQAIVGKCDVGGQALEWPWDRPATTIQRDERIPPPGHHEGNAYMSAPEARGTKRRTPRVPQSERAADPSAPAPVVHSREDRQGHGSPTLEWPWETPSTVVFSEPRIAPPGGHPRTAKMQSVMSSPNAIVLSERAAAILQGFPEGWLFAGDTKKARWSQIGQAMPPPLAHAVATSIVAQMERARKGRAA